VRVIEARKKADVMGLSADPRVLSWAACDYGNAAFRAGFSVDDQQFVRSYGAGRAKRVCCVMSLGVILLIVLTVAFLGGVSRAGGGRFYGTGYNGAASLLLGMVLLLVLVGFGKI
jgi:hypothetical protein